MQNDADLVFEDKLEIKEEEADNDDIVMIDEEVCLTEQNNKDIKEA